MSSNNRDRWGYSTDPEIRKLEFLLGDLAAQYRGEDDPIQQKKIVQEYHVTVQRLEELAWEGIIDWESELPNDLMPTNYRRDPTVKTNWSFPSPSLSLWQQFLQILSRRVSK
jgi:hypothetical protein